MPMPGRVSACGRAMAGARAAAPAPRSRVRRVSFMAASSVVVMAVPGRWTQDVVERGSLAGGQVVARQAPAGHARQFHALQLVVTDGLEVGLVGVVFLLSRLDQREGADEHEVVALLLAGDDGLALREE